MQSCHFVRLLYILAYEREQERERERERERGRERETLDKIASNWWVPLSSWQTYINSLTYIAAKLQYPPKHSTSLTRPDCFWNLNFTQLYNNKSSHTDNHVVVRIASNSNDRPSTFTNSHSCKIHPTDYGQYLWFFLSLVVWYLACAFYLYILYHLTASEKILQLHKCTWNNSKHVMKTHNLNTT